MQRDQRSLSGNVPASHSVKVGGYNDGMLVGHYMHDAPFSPAFAVTLAGTKYEIPGQLNAFEFQPTETCPKKFIIFDQTDNTNKVMFHPDLAHGLGTKNVKLSVVSSEEGHEIVGRGADWQDKVSSFKEETEDIKALLNSEEENGEDDEVVSTGRTLNNNWRCTSSNPCCSMEGLRSHKLRIPSTAKQICVNSSTTRRKRNERNRMVKALRSIIPGGDQVDASLVLDEAINYLKSLKAELEKLGIQNLDD